MSETDSDPDEILTTDGVIRDLGPQPLADVLARLNLKPHDLVEASPNQITHKLITRAIKGRRLTSHSKRLVQQALSAACGKLLPLSELFNY